MNEIIAAVSGQALVNAVIWILIAGLIFWLLTYLINYLAVPEPFNKIVRAILIIVAVVICINALLTIVGRGFIAF